LDSHIKGKNRLVVYENRVLWRRRKREDITGEWKELHNDEIHTPYISPDINKMIK
jgi:hypothetical protein